MPRPSPPPKRKQPRPQQITCWACHIWPRIWKTGWKNWGWTQAARKKISCVKGPERLSNRPALGCRGLCRAICGAGAVV